MIWAGVYIIPSNLISFHDIFTLKLGKFKNFWAATINFPHQKNEKKHGLKTDTGFYLIFISRSTYFLQFLGGGTFFSFDPGPKGGSNFRTHQRSHLTSVRGPISYKIRFHHYFLIPSLRLQTITCSLTSQYITSKILTQIFPPT